MGFLESANSLMGHNIYEQRELEKMAEELGNSDVEKEDGLDTISANVSDEEEGDISGDEGEDEIEMISVDDAIRAIQMVIDGEAETAEDAIELVKSESDDEDEEGLEGDGEVEGDLGDSEIEECKQPKELSEEGECEEDECEEKEVDEYNNNYGESHSLFLKLSQRYL